MDEEIRVFIAENADCFKTAKGLHEAIKEEFPGVELGYSTVTKELRSLRWSEKARSSHESAVVPLIRPFPGTSFDSWSRTPI